MKHEFIRLHAQKFSNHDLRSIVTAIDKMVEKADKKAGFKPKPRRNDNM